MYLKWKYKENNHKRKTIGLRKEEEREKKQEIENVSTKMENEGNIWRRKIFGVSSFFNLACTSSRPTCFFPDHITTVLVVFSCCFLDLIKDWQYHGLFYKHNSMHSFRHCSFFSIRVT